MFTNSTTAGLVAIFIHPIALLAAYYVTPKYDLAQTLKILG